MIYLSLNNFNSEMRDDRIVSIKLTVLYIIIINTIINSTEFHRHINFIIIIIIVVIVIGDIANLIISKLHHCYLVHHQCLQTLHHQWIVTCPTAHWPSYLCLMMWLSVPWFSFECPWNLLYLLKKFQV